jgi:putative transposase
MLGRQGIVMNQKKLRRLYREEKLQVRRRGGRKRALGTRRPMLFPEGVSGISCLGGHDGSDGGS